jgi:hypothetical protein
MRNTQKIFELLSKGAFISVDTVDANVRSLYNDIEDNFSDYESYFREIGLRLESGEGYFYFSRDNEVKQSIETKLEAFAKWIDILDFLRTYDLTFSVGYQFRGSQIAEKITLDVELRDKARKLFRNKKSNQEVVGKVISELEGMGFAELVNELDETYKVTSAFRYVEDLVKMIIIYNEEEVPES